MSDPKLFMILLGCKPTGRNTEQHDVFFGVADTLKDLKQDMIAFWKEADGRIHIDGWREVRFVDGFRVDVIAKAGAAATGERLFFINLGGYKQNEFEEFHYKLLAVAPNRPEAIQKARQTAFYKHTGFPGAASHIDDKYGIDVDDIYEIKDILPERFKKNFSIRLSRTEDPGVDELHLGYLKFDKL